ncbi:hypothetical protein LCGC14_3034880, partial [marine sediment metagenome]
MAYALDKHKAMTALRKGQDRWLKELSFET